jgi:L-fuconolactonase
MTDTPIINSPFRQLYVGRDEKIIDPDLPIIDSHHHLFIRPAISYMVPEYLRDITSGHRVVASVYVETQFKVHADGPQMLSPLGEIDFATEIGIAADGGMFDGRRICAAIVGFADLRYGDAIDEYLEVAMMRSPNRLRGVRQVTLEDPTGAAYRFLPKPPPIGVFRHPLFRQGFRHLAKRGLSFDVSVFHPQMNYVADLAGAFPDTTIILNHAGSALALGMDAEGRRRIFDEWRSSLAHLIHFPNVMCKVGGFGLPFWGFRFEERADPIGSEELAAAWKPYVEVAIEAFGVSRCMMESNYPPDSRSSGYVPLWNALKLTVEGASRDEKAALFHGTAARVYRVALENTLQAAR